MRGAGGVTVVSHKRRAERHVLRPRAADERPARQEYPAAMSAALCAARCCRAVHAQWVAHRAACRVATMQDRRAYLGRVSRPIADHACPFVKGPRADRLGSLSVRPLPRERATL